MDLRYLGLDAFVAEHHLEWFGQKVTLSDADAVNAIKGGASLIPESDYKACGFTCDEERKFKVSGTYDPASDDPEIKTFLAKKHQAALRFHDLHYGDTAALLMPVVPVKFNGGEV